MKVYHLERKDNKPNIEVVCSYTYLNKRYAKYIASIFNG